MERFLSVLLAFLLLLTPVVGASATPSIDLAALSDGELTELASAIVKEQQSRAQAEGGYIVSQQFDSFFVGVKGYELTKDYEDTPCIVVSMDFSHTSDEAEMFVTTVGTTAYQDGIQLETAIIMGIDSNLITKVKSGATLEVRCFYKLTSSSPVEFEVKDMFDFMGKQPVLETTFVVE